MVHIACRNRGKSKTKRSQGISPILRPNHNSMSLIIKLKPYEKIIIAGAVITNGGGAANLLIENKVSVLREKNILKEEDADSPARRIYFVVQLMYMDQEKIADYHKGYWEYVRDFVKAAPTSLGLINAISAQILGGRYYKALKLARRLIDHEQAIIASNRKA
jgi:flagellar biosynthesis repressor protein FlbT